MEQALKVANSGKLRAWYQASRAPFFVATLVPLTLAGVIAYKHGSWNTARWIVICVASFLVHMNTNLANDYFEFLSGADSGESIGGSRVLQDGKLTLSEIRRAMILFYIVALMCGLWILWVTKLWWLIGLMLFSFLSSLFYTAPPIRYGYFGLGELFVGINMGPIMVVGGAAVISGQFIAQAVWLSLPIGFMVAMILYFQSLPDIDEDRAVGKHTIASRLGQPTAIWGVRLFVAITLLSVVLLVISGLLHTVALLSLLTLILAARIDKMIRWTKNWKDLHERGGQARLFYLINGLIIIFSVGLCS